MANDPNALTNMWMLNPWMFDPTQNSNQFSNYNNAPFPFPPTYNTGPAGGVMNAATGKPIQSFQTWQQQNPGGVNINATPAQPQAAPAAAAPQGAGQSSLMQQPAMQQLMGNYQAAQAAMTPQQQAIQAQNDAMRNQQLQEMQMASDLKAGQGGFGNMQGGAFNPNPGYTPPVQAAPQQQTAAPAASSSGGAPNNWYAALNALANPGNPVTQGATVPMAMGSQPSGGINSAFLNQAGGGAGMNQGFLNALRSIQNRPQGVA